MGDNITIFLKGIRYESEDWIYSGSRCRSVVGSSELINVPSVSMKGDEFLGRLFASDDRFCFMLLVTNNFFEL
jgi:hypothetical protein